MLITTEAFWVIVLTAGFTFWGLDRLSRTGWRLLQRLLLRRAIRRLLLLSTKSPHIRPRPTKRPWPIAVNPHPNANNGSKPPAPKWMRPAVEE